MMLSECQLPEHVERTSDMPLFLAETRDRIEEVLSGKGRCLVAIDGVPGAGKSTLINAINEGYQILNPVIHGMDNHLITARDTPERARMHESEDDFRELYSNDEDAQRVLRELLETQNDVVWPGKIYSRSTGGHLRGQAIGIPNKDKRLIIFEGTGAIQVCKELRGDVINLLVYADPETAVQAKIYRDQAMGIEARELFHKKDNELACHVRLKPTLEDRALSGSIYALDNTQALLASMAA